MNDTHGRGLWDQIETLWIVPEVERRKTAGTLQNNFQIRQCLILFHRDKPPEVKFNDEVTWNVKMEHAHTEGIKPGDPIYTYQIKRLHDVQLPEEDGRRIAFWYLFYTGRSGEYGTVFDFSPNNPDFDPSASSETTKSWVLASLQAIFEERIVRSHDLVQAAMHAAGLWAAPALMPYPMSRIVNLVEDGKPAEATTLLLENTDDSKVSALSARWWEVLELNSRRFVLEQAIDAHLRGQYALAVHALSPTIEGIVTDWLYRVSPPRTVPFRQESKLKAFRDIVLRTKTSSFADKRIAESTVEFILDGPVLETFKNWTDEPTLAFPNRHAVQHGRFASSLYTRESSTKLVLLIDTIAHIIADADAGLDPPGVTDTSDSGEDPSD